MLGLQRFWLHRRDRYDALTWMIKVGTETHLGGGVSPLAAIARALRRLPVVVPFSLKAHEDSDHTTVIAVVHWRLHAKLTVLAKLWVL